MEKNQELSTQDLEIINSWYDIQESLAIHFSEFHRYEISQEDIFNALFIQLTDKFNLEWQGDLWDLQIEHNEALEVLADFNFETLKRQVISESNILPEDLLMNYKVRIKLKGLIWIIHKYDKDPFPSNPHAHQLDNNIKLDLSNGRCYKVKQYIETIKKKDLIFIRTEATRLYNIQLPELTI